MSKFSFNLDTNGTLSNNDRVFWMGVRQIALNLVDIIERRLEFDDNKRTAYLRKIIAPHNPQVKSS